MTVAQRLAEALVAAGIQRAYGLPGEDHPAVLEALAASGVEYCTAYNESSAVIMASADAHLTGRPGLAVLSLAPGVSNGVNGLLNAYLEQIPMIVISGQHAGAQQPLVVRQGFDISSLVAPVTKWQGRIAEGSDVTAIVGKAIDEALAHPPGPVYLELPDQVAVTEARGGTDPMSLTRGRASLEYAEVRVPSPAALDQLRGQLAEAERPVLVVGGRRGRLRPETVRRFVERWQVPVLNSVRQKGIVDPSNPWFAGTFLNGNLESALLGRADRVLFVDPDPFDFYNRPWGFDAPVTALTEPGFSEWLLSVETRFAVDADAMLDALTDAGPGSPSGWSVEDVSNYRKELRAGLLAPSGEGMSVAQAVAAALEAWPSDGYLVADAGFSKPLVAMLSEPAVPDRFLASHALSTMGYCIPAAVAIGRASDQPVLGFLGDGSLLMRATEMITSPRTGANTVWVAVMDRCLTQIGVKQERRGVTPVGVDLPAISCARLANALGIAGVDVTDPDELKAAVDRGLRGGGPLLIGAVVDPAPSRELFEVLRG